MEEDADLLRQLEPRLCLEIGSGSGCVSTFIASILGPSAAVYLCTDINPAAACATLRTGRQNSVTLEPVLTSLHYPLAERLRAKIDLLVFNPPYVPTEEEEELAGQLDAGIVASWAGGLEGITTTKLLMQAVPMLLSTQGRFYLVAVQQNKPLEIIAKMQEFGLDGKVVLKRRAGGEVLHVLLFTKAH